jgi:hypothetical protein
LFRLLIICQSLLSSFLIKNFEFSIAYKKLLKR